MGLLRRMLGVNKNVDTRERRCLPSKRLDLTARTRQVSLFVKCITRTNRTEIKKTKFGGAMIASPSTGV